MLGSERDDKVYPRDYLILDECEDLYSDADAKSVVKKLGRYSEEDNPEKMRYYLGVMRKSRLIWNRALKKYGSEWIKDKFAKYIFVKEKHPGMGCGTPKMDGEIKDSLKGFHSDLDNSSSSISGDKPKISANEYLQRIGLKNKPCLSVDSIVGISSGMEDPYADYDTDEIKIEEDTKPTSGPHPKEVLAAIEEKLSRVSMDSIQPFRMVDLVRSKKDKTFADHLFLKAVEKKEKEDRLQKLKDEEMKFVIKCSTRRYANDPDEEPEVEHDPVVAVERFHYEKFTSDVKSYIYEGNFPVMRIIEYMMDFCDLGEILTFEENNPGLSKELEILWRRRCKLDYDGEEIKYGSTWKETYMGYRTFVQGIVGKTTVDLQKSNEELAAKRKLAMSNMTDSIDQKRSNAGICKRKRRSDIEGVLPTKKQATSKKKMTPLMAQTCEMYKSIANNRRRLQ
ncbi:hypothetical protein ACOME3_009202 [Neoechinorhynchus agilis]